MRKGAAYSADTEDLNDPRFQTHYAVNVTSAIPMLIRTDNYGYEASREGFTQPGTETGRILEGRFGICGHHAAVALDLYEYAGIQARYVQFFYNIEGERDNHITVEVLIDGRWRYTDTSYGAVWIESEGELATLEDVLQAPERGLKWTSTLLPFHEMDNHPLLRPLRSDSDIVRGGVGSVRIRQDEDFHALPRYVGNGLELVAGLTGDYELTIDIADVHPGPEATLCVDDACFQVSPGLSSMMVTDPQRIRRADAGMVRIDSLTLREL